ncbi:gliding motility lipoprotein GldD [Aureicoccus marinus]|jgi:gliding motility-associated lipoprotein GldD|uniref:Gliding motility lipoprotein GldD n=1 Tax=Aureicoccus marinus TaxID=754435 RepID=A0A2S7TA04_9FLAO|nr:gliding motility lipoprotein GldD [Aureicoccus marinus]PQJ16411.1 gliding motility lipoprotein GldD [Aureicoccus marinus]
MKLNWLLFVLIFILFFECEDSLVPKPKAQLRLDFPEAKYVSSENTACDYTMDVNLMSIIKQGEDCSIVVEYPQLKGSIYLTYKKVEDNLETLLIDAQKLSYEHVVKADQISEQPFINDKDKVYGMFYEVSGNAASQSQFYVTDSTDHFLAGSLYFYAKPNYDSIMPAAVYLQKDIRHLMESLKWKK